MSASGTLTVCNELSAVFMLCYSTMMVSLSLRAHIYHPDSRHLQFRWSFLVFPDASQSKSLARQRRNDVRRVRGGCFLASFPAAELMIESKSTIRSKSI